MNCQPHPREIQRWYPSKWSDIVGNSAMVQVLLDFIQNGMCNALFTGPNRSGKTRTILLGIRAMLCTDRTATLDPCGECSSCRMLGEARTSHYGLFSSFSFSEYEFHPIDCQTVTAEDLDTLRYEGELEKPTTIVYLDEVAVLRSRRLEGKLLKLVDETPAVWIGSAISLKRTKGKRKGEWTERLSREMKGRFAVKVGTSHPHPTDLKAWIETRSREWNITIQQPELTISKLIERTGGRVGYVLHFLAFAASKTGRTIDFDDAKRFNFETD